MSELLSAASAQFGRLPFLVQGSSQLTFAEAEESVQRRAALLPSAGVIAIVPTIGFESVIEIFAALRVGAAAVLVPRHWPAARVSEQLARIEPSSLSETVIFTSGSSGVPKAVRLTQVNWRTAATASSEFYEFGPGLRWLLTLPLFHVGGLSILFRALVSGGAAVLVPQLTPEDLDECDLASLVPSQLLKLAEMRPPSQARLLIGGAPLAPALIARAAGWHIDRTYGMTETTAVIASGPPTSEWMTVFEGIEITAAADGRLQVRGEQVSPGYVGEPERLPDEWFVTSDLGLVRRREVLVSGRADRVINTGGENVDPTEIERLLESSPGVTEAAAFGVPDEHWGEVVAVVFAGSALPDDLVALIERRLGPLSRPRFIRQVESLPRNALGKVDFDSVSIIGALGAKNRHS